MIKYKFYCPTCEKEVKRKEIYPVVIQHETTPTGFPRQVIVRAFHFLHRKGWGDLKITVLEDTEIQNKLKYSFDEEMSGRNKQQKIVSDFI